MPYRPAAPTRLSRQLSTKEALRLLRNVDLGRLVFVSRAAPAIRLVGHVLDDDRLIVGTRYDPELAAVLRRATPVRLTYQADMVDPATHLGWSVTVTGPARVVAGVGELNRLRPRLRGLTGESLDLLAQIRPEVISGVAVGSGTC
jgi:hypothetical protein